MVGRYPERGSCRGQSHSSHIESLGCFKSLAGALTFDAPSVLRNPHGLRDTLDAFACSLHFTTSVPLKQLLFSNSARHRSIISHHHGMGPRAGDYKEEPAPVAGDPVSHVKYSSPCSAVILAFWISSLHRTLALALHLSRSCPAGARLAIPCHIQHDWAVCRPTRFTWYAHICRDTTAARFLATDKGLVLYWP